jgi:hypothetical protein
MPFQKAHGKPKANRKIYRTSVETASNSYRGGQGYESMGFEGEQRVVNCEWAERRESSD